MRKGKQRWSKGAETDVAVVLCIGLPPSAQRVFGLQM
jgi:hypothetical protein